MPYLTIYTHEAIHEWLIGKRATLSELGAHADQDIDHSFACERRPGELFELLRTPGITQQRAFDIACAICGRIVWLLDIDDLPDEVRDDADRKAQIAELVSFVRDHRSEFDAYDEYNCLGMDYEETIVPLIKEMA